IAPETEPGQPAEAGPVAPSAPAQVDMGRRRFFRVCACELIQTPPRMAGSAQALQQASADAASAILNPEGAAGLLGPAGDATIQTPSGPTRVRTAFRADRGGMYSI